MTSTLFRRFLLAGLTLAGVTTALSAQNVRDLIPAAAPVGARIMITGLGLADPSISVKFAGTTSTATVVQRADRAIEVVVPTTAVTGNLRVTTGATLVELPFTVTSDPQFIVSTLAGGPQAQNQPLKHPWGAAVVLPGGTIAVADEQHHQIKLIAPAGSVSVLAGGGQSGYVNGIGTAAQFKSPRGIAYDARRDVLYVADSGNHVIRQVTMAGVVTLLAGSAAEGHNDGKKETAIFKSPHGLTVGSDGAVYVADTKNHRIRRVAPDGTTTTFAGSERGDRATDGPLLSATFYEPRGIIAAGDDLYVADTKNNAIRKISGGQVTTVLLFPRTGDDDDPADSGDGDPKILNRPSGIGVDEAGHLIVSDSENDFIRRIDLRTTPATMTIIAGTGRNGFVDGAGTVAQFKDPVGLAVAGAIYVADEDNDALRRLCPEVRVSGILSLTGAVSAGTEVRVFGTGFVPGGTTVQIDGVAAVDVMWISSTELSVKLPRTMTGGSVSVTITSCGGSAGPTTFIVDNTAPVLTITNGGAPLADNALFKVPIVPMLTATDDIDPAPSVTATLNGLAFISGTTISGDGVYTLVGIAEDAAGNRATQTLHFTLDATPPVVAVLEGSAPIPPGSFFNRSVIVDLQIADLTTTMSDVRIDGAPYTLKQPYAIEGTHALTAKVTDALGNETNIGPIAFTIDLTRPVLTFTSHTNGQAVSTRDVTVIGGSDDAVTVRVNGVDAIVDATVKTFTVALVLQEGENVLTATGIDRASNSGTATLALDLDTRGPELTVESTPACTKSDSTELRGTVADAHVDKVVLTLGDTSVPATVNAGTWKATLPLGSEGRKTILIKASDTAGHRTTRSVTITADRTAPVIDISESGVPFAGSIVSRVVAPFIRATDADAEAVLAATLDGSPFTSGTQVSAEGAHTMRVVAKDCAGNETTRELAFTVDLTAPRFLTFNPASGSKTAQVPSALSGTTDADAIEVRVSGTALTAPVTNGIFTIPNIGFADGINDRTLELIDRAGHTTRASYTIGVRTAKPLVEIIESGEAIVEGTVYRRPVEPRIRVFDPDVTFTATLGGTPFTSGAAITADGSYTVTATATDTMYGHASSVTRTFSIDRTGPVVNIVSPTDGASFDSDRIDVRATATDAVSVSVNAVPAVKQPDNSWLASSIVLDLGGNTLTATGRDGAGNSASDSVDVIRASAGPAIVLTFPPDNYLTNRPRLDVAGRVLRPGSAVAVTVPPAGAVTAAVDAAGSFRVSGAQLREGESTIQATATEGGKSVTATARVIADFTPPRVRILESGQALTDGAGFATQAVLSGDATDKGQSLVHALVVDGNPVTPPFTVTAVGGHTALITARDASGNESRLEQTFFVGSAGAAGCGLEAFDPPDQAIINSQRVELVGRSGGTAGVKVNGIAAKMASGSFCANVELPQEGANAVTIVCTDAAGQQVGTPVTIALNRVTNDPSVTISAPVEDFVTQDETLVVTGTLGNGATSVDVNGKAASINGTNWTVTDVRLQDGVNVLVARAKNAGGRTASASRRVTYLKDPPSLAISAPLPGFITGMATVDVSGTWSGVEPSSLAIEGLAGAVVPEPWSDTTGRFVATAVPLQVGDNIIRISGRDRTGRIARAEVMVKYAANLPAITISTPADNHYYPESQGSTFRVSGSFVAVPGSSIDVNGVAATIDATAKTFFADVAFSTLPGGLTPVVAQLGQPGGESGFDTVRVFKLAGAPRVLETFPAANAFEVNPGAVVLVLFSAPMERASVAAAFMLENATGTAVSGKALLDKDVLTFAPATTLTPGERYTVRVAATAKDLAGQPLAEAVANSFVVATTAPNTAPVITTASGRICAQLIDVAGTTTPGVRVRLDYGQVFFVTTASSSGAFSYRIPLSGQQGFHIIRLRTIGADGTLSPAAELKLNVDCTGPRVLSASYDRSVNKLTIVFSREVKQESVTTGAIQLVSSNGTAVSSAVSANAANVTVTPSPSLAAATFTLKVSTGVEDTQGRKLEFAHTQLFAFGDVEPRPGDGSGSITGEVYDATTGRPLAGATITIEVPAAAFARAPGVASSLHRDPSPLRRGEKVPKADEWSSLERNATDLQRNSSEATLPQSSILNPAADAAVTMVTDARGRYGDRFPEGAHTIRASANGYTTVWRQIIVSAGAGVIPIDIRLTRNGQTRVSSTGALTLTHGGENAVTRLAELNIPAGAVISGTTVTLTATGAQSLAGLLPLGWSPLASAVITSAATNLPGATLSFAVPQPDIVAATQSLAAVRYDPSRDEWRVTAPVVNISSNKATFDVNAPGAFALVYADRRAGLTSPPPPSAGAALQGVTDPCAPPASCPAMVAKSFPLNPPIVLPSGSAVATLNIDGAAARVYPSGTAVQAYIDEELRLADGGRELDPPFATDLLLYRDLAGDTAVATFNLAPSPRAAEVFLEVGFDHIRILPYPGRLDRGTLVGPEGGRVPADEKVAVEIPTGATPVELRATASSLADPQSFGPITGYAIIGGLQLTLQHVGLSSGGDVPAPVELTIPARATFTVSPQSLILNPQSQVILVEILDQTPYGNRMFRLAAEMTALDATRWTTKAIDRGLIPVDGIIREGRYLLLAPQAPIAFAKGIVRAGANSAATATARLTTPGLGVGDLTRLTGIFALPVPSTPAAPFTLTPRTVRHGDGATYQHSSAPAKGEVVNVGDLVIVAQPPRVSTTIPVNHATNVSLTTTVEVSLTPGIDPSSVNAQTLTVIDTTNGASVTGTVAALGTLGVRWTLPPGETLKQGSRYSVVVSPSIRGINGTPLGQTYAFSFTTTSVLTSDEVHPERIRITMPDANGVSKIIASAGALKTNWIAIPVRRDRDFMTRYSATTGADGSFSLSVGTDPRDRVTIADEIDLRVLNTNGALVAIVPLTPFASEDGRAFVATRKSATFTSVDGFTVSVPAGAFDEATLVSINPLSEAVFSGVPRFNEELKVAAAVRITFEGRANRPLELKLPVLPGTDLTRPHFLGILGESTRGPRIMAVDPLHVSGGALSTLRPSSGSSNLHSFAVGSNLTGFQSNDPGDYTQGVIEEGQYAALEMKQVAASNGMVWAFMDGLATAVELLFDALHSMYVGHRYVYEARGRITFPIPAGVQFTVTAIDPATSLTAFQQTYSALPLGDPGVGTVIPSPATDFAGPRPVFGTPFRVESAGAPPVGLALDAISGLRLTLSDTGSLSIDSTSALVASTKVSVLHVPTGALIGPAALPLTLSGVKQGDELVAMIEQKEIDPATPLSIVFNEGIDIGPTSPSDAPAVSDALKALIKVEKVSSSGASPVDLLSNALLRLDSGNRRVTVLLPSPLPAGADVRLTLDGNIVDRSGNGLGLGQAGEQAVTGGGVTPIGSRHDIVMRFSTREPAGPLSEFDIRQSDASSVGQIRELARHDNLLFVTALNGGILAYDLSDPAALDDSSATRPKPIAQAPAGITDYWTLQIDHHGRVFAAGTTSMFGVMRTFRVEDFVNAEADPDDDCMPSVTNANCHLISGAALSQMPGSVTSIGIGSLAVITDRVEAIPRKLKVVVGDDPFVTHTRQQLLDTFAGGVGTPVDPALGATGLVIFQPKIPAVSTTYRLQRITIENVTLGLRWSADAKATSTTSPLLAPARFKNVIAGPNDVLRVTHNRTTHAVVSLFGYGIGVFDVNAIESNDQPFQFDGGEKPKEQVAQQSGFSDLGLPPSSIGDIRYSPDSEILGIPGGALRVYALDSRKGVVELHVELPSSISRAGELIFTAGHPRFEALKTAVLAVEPDAIARFNSSALYKNANTKRSYLLMPALRYGLLAVEAGSTPITSESFADVVWFPGGANAVRVIDRTNLAIVIDGEGYGHLVDLSRLDERDQVTTPDALFPTAAASIPLNKPDPRILWTSDKPIATGAGTGAGFIPPIVDPDTGMMYTADLLSRRVRVGSVMDPKIRIVAEVGDPTGPKQVTSIVPLGIDPPAGVLKCNPADASCRASLGVFRVEATLPGSMEESLASPMRVAIESERVAGNDVAQTPLPYPRAHLRQSKRDGSADPRTTNFVLRRVLDVPTVPELRYQKGYNHFASDWVAAIADPRAAKEYGPAPTDCPACKRPAYLAALANVHELYTAGRFIAVRPEMPVGAYSFLTGKRRMTTRVATTPADTVRPVEALVAAQHPPVAEGMLQETTYMHSGEVETRAMDYDAGGRAGWNVIIDRTYRSRTVGLTPLGSGWDSALFRRLRALPNGDVEYRDGAEVWRFKLEANAYRAPTGLFLRLVRQDSGWTIIDQRFRITRFDDYGRMVSESDEFHQPREAGSGNTVLYLYDGDGSLKSVVDPVGRATTLKYVAGRVETITDWHDATPRSIDYRYTNGALTKVELPDVPNITGARPTIQYAYQAAGGGYKPQIELATNLDTIIDPGISAARVDFDYDSATDRVKAQKWATGESANFTFGLPTTATVTDVLGQERTYTLTGANSTTDPSADRAHASKVTGQVDIWSTSGFGQLPGVTLVPGAPAVSTASRTRELTYEEGSLKTSAIAGLGKTELGWELASGAPGRLMKSETTSPVGGGASSFLPASSPISRIFHYQGTGAFLKAVDVGGKKIEAPRASSGPRRAGVGEQQHHREAEVRQVRTAFKRRHHGRPRRQWCGIRHDDHVLAGHGGRAHARSTEHRARGRAGDEIRLSERDEYESH